MPGWCWTRSQMRSQGTKTRRSSSRLVMVLSGTHLVLLMPYMAVNLCLVPLCVGRMGCAPPSLRASCLLTAAAPSVPQVCRVGLPELQGLMLGGEMLLPSIATCYMALERIQEQLRRQQHGR